MWQTGQEEPGRVVSKLGTRACFSPFSYLMVQNFTYFPNIPHFDAFLKIFYQASLFSSRGWYPRKAKIHAAVWRTTAFSIKHTRVFSIQGPMVTSKIMERRGSARAGSQDAQDL